MCCGAGALGLFWAGAALWFHFFSPAPVLLGRRAWEGMASPGEAPLGWAIGPAPSEGGRTEGEAGDQAGGAMRQGGATHIFRPGSELGRALGQT
jgi:hypothetical protein